MADYHIKRSEKLPKRGKRSAKQAFQYIEHFKRASINNKVITFK